MGNEYLFLIFFRKPIGKQGVKKIYKHSIDKYGGDAQDDNVSIDTIAQEKNISYPTDSKLQKKIIDKYVKITHFNIFTSSHPFARFADLKNKLK